MNTLAAASKPPVETAVANRKVESEMKAAKDHRERYMSALPTDVFNTLLLIVDGRVIPQKERNSVDKSAYRVYYSTMGVLTAEDIEMPLTGVVERRLLFQTPEGEKLILLQVSECLNCVEEYYKRNKGESARKLKKRIETVFCGVGERIIQKYINNSRHAQSIKGKFENKAKLHPVTSDTVWNRVQIDLMSMIDMPVEIDGKTYQWVLSCIDVFSRYLVLKPLYSKDTAVVSEQLINIFSDLGIPSIIQSDRGSEFLGYVTKLAKALNVKMIHSSPRHPQSQGKDERSHRTVRDKMRFDIVEEVSGVTLSEGAYNWVLHLPLYQLQYNSSFHKSLGDSPYKVVFGRESCYNTNMRASSPATISLSEGDNGDACSSVEMSEGDNVDACEMSEGDNGDACEMQVSSDVTKDDKSQTVFHQRAMLLASIREKAANKSKRCNEQMVASHAAKNPPSVYRVGEDVLVKFDSKKWNRVKGKGLSVPPSMVGKVLQVKGNKYKVRVNEGANDQVREEWVDVSKITSQTRADEKLRDKVEEAKVGTLKDFITVTTSLKATTMQKTPLSQREKWIDYYHVRSTDLTSYNTPHSKDSMVRLSPFSITYGHFSELTNGAKVNMELVDLYLAMLSRDPETTQQKMKC